MLKYTVERSDSYSRNFDVIAIGCSNSEATTLRTMCDELMGVTEKPKPATPENPGYYTTSHLTKDGMEALRVAARMYYYGDAMQNKITTIKHIRTLSSLTSNSPILDLKSAKELMDYALSGVDRPVWWK